MDEVLWRRSCNRKPVPTSFVKRKLIKDAAANHLPSAVIIPVGKGISNGDEVLVFWRLHAQSWSPSLSHAIEKIILDGSHVTRIYGREVCVSSTLTSQPPSTYEKNVSTAAHMFVLLSTILP